MTAHTGEIAPVPTRETGLRVSVAYLLARELVKRRQAGQAKSAHATTSNESTAVASDWSTYGDWRHHALHHQFHQNFGADSVRGKDVMDFGCGDGQLCWVMLDAGAANAHGVDIDDNGLARFAARLAQDKGERRPTFRRGTSYDKIDEASESFDAIFCLDVLEHVSEYRAIIHEWFRVLRPGGSVYIWWQPYWHPFGHHAHYWLPIPWAHVFLNDRQMTEVCARIVEWPEFDAPVFDRHADGSRRNRFREPGAADDDFLNKLTIREFERCCAQAGFVMSRREFQPFTWRQPVRGISSLMTRVPKARDFFTSVAVYEITRPKVS